ncbi:hypothetical protein B0H14DRAFT_3880488 [Mycena olivaceomarginata]|nr:hypothetical protein B0H14DRAFT_3880488 [Mycena olivaceomarginata]
MAKYLWPTSLSPRPPPFLVLLQLRIPITSALFQPYPSVVDEWTLVALMRNAGSLADIMSWLILFGTFGYAYTLGVYEDYYVRVYLTNHTPSSIAYMQTPIHLPQITDQVGIVVSGKIFDAGGFYAVEAVGGLIFTFLVMRVTARDASFTGGGPKAVG